MNRWIPRCASRQAGECRCCSLPDEKGAEEDEDAMLSLFPNASRRSEVSGVLCVCWLALCEKVRGTMLFSTWDKDTPKLLLCRLSLEFLASMIGHQSRRGSQQKKKRSRGAPVISSASERAPAFRSFVLFQRTNLTGGQTII